MEKKNLNTIKELIYWSYANLAMAQDAVKRGITAYDRTSFIIRSRLFKGLSSGTMHMKSLFDDEKYKVMNGAKCVYCGADDNLSIDHLIPKASGGVDASDNLVCACRKCNSSKGDTNLIEWYLNNNKFPPLMILRRYLKLVYLMCQEKDILDKTISFLDAEDLPFTSNDIPIDYPNPKFIKL